MIGYTLIIGLAARVILAWLCLTTGFERMIDELVIAPSASAACRREAAFRLQRGISSAGAGECVVPLALVSLPAWLLRLAAS